MEDLDTGAISLIVPPLATLLGVWLGARLHRKAALEAAREERQHASEQLVQQRKEEAAARLDNAILEAYGEAPKGSVDIREAADQLPAMWSRLLEASTRTAILDDPEIERRLHALTMTVGMASRARNWRQPASEPQTINLWPIEIAVRELREALTYYQRRKSPPAAQYPTSKELTQIVHKEGTHRFEALNDWLLDREIF